MTDYGEIRRQLHEHPQTAGCEQYAHDLIVKHLQGLHPDKMYTHVGGYGVIAVWGGDEEGRAVVFRADTDALPIGHRCGHDGHTTILMRLAELVDSRPAGDRRTVILIWQPAEETGQGARAVMESGILERYDIEAIYGMHNIPGYELGQVVVCDDTFAAASTGVVFSLTGRETHASTPEMGQNPGLAVAEMVQAFDRLNVGLQEALCDGAGQVALGTFRQSTLICVRLGEPAFGTSAGRAEVMVTLRAFTNSAMESLLADADLTARNIAAKYGLGLERALVEPFRATENDAACVATVRKAAADVSLEVCDRAMPMRWSEDFAEYLTKYRGAMFGMGSGTGQHELHHPDYDFPDGLVEPAARLMEAISFCQSSSPK